MLENLTKILGIWDMFVADIVKSISKMERDIVSVAKDVWQFAQETQSPDEC